MKILVRYSHLNGEEHMLVHHPQLWKDVRETIASVDAEKCRTKVSEESKQKGELLYSPVELNKAFRREFEKRGWHQYRVNFWTAHNEKLLSEIHQLSEHQQKQRIEQAGYSPIRSYNQIDFAKDRVAAEVQFGKYAFVAHDLYVKPPEFLCFRNN